MGNLHARVDDRIMTLRHRVIAAPIVAPDGKTKANRNKAIVY
jgi:hypothetical protein